MIKHNQWGQYLRDGVYGALDGTVTTFAILAGATGANLSVNVIIVLGFANLLADGFSMATGSYMGERSELQFYLKQKQDVEQGIANNPDALTKELKNIYLEKGMTGKNLDQFVTAVVKTPAVWRDEVLMHRGITHQQNNPLLSGLITFLAFVIVGFVPLAPVIFLPEVNFFDALGLVAAVLFLVGSLRSKITAIGWLRGGLEVMAAGIAASLIAFFVGEFLSGLLI